MDHLLLRLQWLDERGNSLLELTDKSTSPIHEALVQLSQMAATGEGLADIREYLVGHSCTLELFESMVLVQVLRMGAELFVRFAHFTEMPLPIVQVGNPGLTKEKRLGFSDQFFKTKPCCRTILP
jgi:hypothetical protein